MQLITKKDKKVVENEVTGLPNYVDITDDEQEDVKQNEQIANK